MKPRPRTGAPARVYPSAVVLPGARLGEDVVVGAFTFVASGAIVGDGTRIQGHTSLWDGVVLGRDVFVGPGAMFTNVRRPRASYSRAPDWDETLVGEGATIGAHATLVAPVSVGPFAMIGAGAVVTKDVPDHAVVAGVPAKIIGWTCDCAGTVVRGRRRPARVACPICASVSGSRARRSSATSRSSRRARK